jgi:hypothetical protein
MQLLRTDNPVTDVQIVSRPFVYGCLDINLSMQVSLMATKAQNLPHTSVLYKIGHVV